jgi:hypothetical protein
MKFIGQPTKIGACGTKPKVIKEFIGRVNSRTSDVSIAKMELHGEGIFASANRTENNEIGVTPKDRRYRFFNSLVP